MRLIKARNFTVSDHYHTDRQDDSYSRDSKRTNSKNKRIKVDDVDLLRKDIKDQAEALKLMFNTGVSVEPRDPLQAALWMEVITRTKKLTRRSKYINALLSDWCKSVSGKWEVPKAILDEMEQVIEELTRHQEEIMFVSPEIKEEFRNIASELDLQTRYWVRRFVPTSDKVLIQPGQTDHLAYALFLIITEGDIAEVKDSLNLYLRYNHALYIPDWVDVRSVVLYPVLLRLAENVRNKLGSTEPQAEAIEEEPADMDAEVGQDEMEMDESDLGAEDGLAEDEFVEEEPEETEIPEEPFDSELESLNAT